MGPYSSAVSYLISLWLLGLVCIALTWPRLRRQRWWWRLSGLAGRYQWEWWRSLRPPAGRAMPCIKLLPLQGGGKGNMHKVVQCKEEAILQPAIGWLEDFSSVEFVSWAIVLVLPGVCNAMLWFCDVFVPLVAQCQCPALRHVVASCVFVRMFPGSLLGLGFRSFCPAEVCCFLVGGWCSQSEFSSRVL